MKRRPLKKVGEILIERGVITLEQLAKGLEEQKRVSASLGASLIRLGYVDYKTLEKVLGDELEKLEYKKLGEMLLENKVISTLQLAEALSIQKKEEKNKHIGEILIERKYLTSQQLFDVLSLQFDVKSVELDNFLFKEEALNLLPYELMCELKVIPLQKTPTHVLIATADPFNFNLMKQVERVLKMAVEPVFAKSESISLSLQKRFSVTIGGEASPSLRDIARQSGSGEKKDDLRNLVHMIIEQAITENASFVHIEPSGSGYSIRFRIDGKLHVESPVQGQLADDLVDHLKETANLSTANRRTMQTGHFLFPIGGRSIACKLTSIPVLTGFETFREKLVVKVLQQTGMLQRLDDVGFYIAVLEKYQTLLKTRQGVVLVVGPADCGITTTLYASLRHINDTGQHIATIEKTIDCFIEGVTQTQIDQVRGLGFKEMLKSTLIEDADAVMIGRVDDAEIARLALQIAMSGRMILAGMACSDATSVYAMLKEKGVENYLLSAGISGILGQRLVRKICGQCRESFTPPSELIDGLGLRHNTAFFRGRGCPACNFSGFKGRIGLFELLA